MKFISVLPSWPDSKNLIELSCTKRGEGEGERGGRCPVWCSQERREQGNRERERGEAGFWGGCGREEVGEGVRRSELWEELL